MGSHTTGRHGHCRRREICDISGTRRNNRCHNVEVPAGPLSFYRNSHEPRHRDGGGNACRIEKRGGLHTCRTVTAAETNRIYDAYSRSRTCHHRRLLPQPS